MKRYARLSQCLLSLAMCLVPFAVTISTPALAQQALSPQQDNQSLYYDPEHFVWLHVENDRLQQDDLLPLLSYEHVVIVLEQPDDLHARRVQVLLDNPPAGLPEIDTYKALLSERTDDTFAIGYLQEEDIASRSKASREYEAYLVTFKHVLRMGTLFRTLHEFANMPDVDFVLPVFFFPDKMAAPFIRFEAEFLAPGLIPGGISQINKINRMNFVKDTRESSNFKEPVVLQLQKDAPTNILATILRYQQMPWMVKRAKLWWLRLRMPVEVQARWDLPTGVNSFSLWEPIRHILSIERDSDVALLPKAFTERAVHTWLADNTHLPEELIQVDRIDKTTQSLEDGRALDEVVLTFRLSKTGTYIFTPYPIQAAYSALNDQRRLNVFRADKPTFLTIPGHLPRQIGQIPGQLLGVTARAVPSWIVPASMIFGVVCMVVGLGWTLKVSTQSLRRAAPELQRDSETQKHAHEAVIVTYQGRLKDVKRRLESLTFDGDMEAEREWLRFLSVFVKQLLGEGFYQDETRLLGGVGTSSHSIKRYMRATSCQPDQEPIAAALQLLHALELQVPKKVLPLTQDEAKDFVAKADMLTEDMFR